MTALAHRACLALLALSCLSFAARADTLVGLTSTNGVFVMTGSVPIAVSPTTPITGLAVGEVVAAIDVRPSNGALYALGVNGLSAHLYVVNILTGAATAVGPAIALPQAPGANASTFYGMTFDPDDRIRVVGYGKDHFRLNPDTAEPTALAAVSSTSVVALAAAADGTVYGIVDHDFGDELVRIGGVGGDPSPDFGAVTAIGALGVDSNASTGLDISPAGIPFALLIGATPRLHTVNLGTGAATPIGPIGTGLTLLDVAALSGRGDVNADGRVNVTDILFLINFLFAGGPTPPP